MDSRACTCVDVDATTPRGCTTSSAPSRRSPAAGPATGEPAIGDLGEDVGDVDLRRLGLRASVRERAGKLQPDRLVRDRGGASTSASRVGFGDLSIHEFATDPTEHLAYSSYYAGGIRVFRFGRQTARGGRQWIADGGSNFWGVEQFTTPQGERLIAGSDRDFGLVILRYTGPGSGSERRRAATPTVMVPFRGSADVPLRCSDANGNPLRQSRTSNSGRRHGRRTSRRRAAGPIRHTGDRLGPAGSFTFRANDGAADSNTATASLVAVASDGGRCFNPFVGSASAT